MKQDRPATGTGLGEGHAGEANGGARVREVRHRPPSGTKCYNRESEGVHVEKRSKIEGEEKKGETGAKPFNIHARKCMETRGPRHTGEWAEAG